MSLMRWILGLAAAVLVGTAGCDRRSSSAAPQAAGEAPKEVRLGYFANLTHAQAVLGVASGDFEKEVAPSMFSTKVFNAGPSLIEALFAGEIDLGYVGPGPALSANERTRGAGIRVVGGAAANGVLIVARKGSGISSLKDLAGKRVATPQHGNTQDISARHYLQAELGLKDLNNVVAITNAEQSAMMERGQIDAAWAPEPWGSRLIVENGATVVAEEKELWPDKKFALTVIVTTPEFLKAHPDVVEKVLRVSHGWTEKLRKDPAGCSEKLGEALFGLTGKRLPAGVAEQAIGRIEFTDEPMAGTFERMGQWSYELGFLRQPPKLEGLFDLDALRRVTGEGHPTTAPVATR